MAYSIFVFIHSKKLTRLEGLCKITNYSKECMVLSFSVADHRDVCVPTSRSGNAISFRLHGMSATSAYTESDEFVESVAINGGSDDADVNANPAEPQSQRHHPRDLVVFGTEQP